MATPKALHWWAACGRPGADCHKGSREKIVNRKSSDHIHRFLIEAKELGLDRNHRFMRLYRVVCHQPNHPVARPAIERLIINARRKHELYGDPFDPAPRSLPGQIHIGQAVRCVARLMLAIFLGNGLLLTNSGGGKSNVHKVLAPLLATKGVSVWTLEFSKGAGKRSFWLFRAYGRHLVVERAKDWVFNLFEVPFASRVQTWIVRAVEILDEVLQIPEAAQDLLHQCLIELFDLLGVFQGSEQYPTFEEVYRYVEGKQDANSQAKAALLRRLRLLLLDLEPGMKQYRRGFDIRDLAEQNLHFDFHGASHRVQNLAALYLIASLFEYRHAHAEPNTSLRNLIILEEALRFLSGSGKSYVAWLFTQVREVGIAFLGLTQTIFGIPDPVLANCSLKVLGRVGHAGDLRFAASMGVTSSDAVSWLLNNLHPGLFLFKLSSGSVLKPFLVQVKLIRPLPPLSEELIRQSQSCLDHSTLRRVNEAHVSEAPATLLLPAPSPTGPTATPDELRFLQAIYDNPTVASSQFARIVGVSMKRCILFRKQLVEKGWITEHWLDSGQRGGRSIVLVLTEQGRRILEQAT